jgi:predicted MFS family arabinose efflux permease
MFLGYAAAQIPGALLLAVYGPARILPLAGGLLCAGLLAFSVSEDFWSLLGSRLLMGVGSAPILPGALAIYLALLGSERFTSMSGVQTAFGRFGVVMATVPFAALIAALGWRLSFLWLAGLTGLVGVGATLVLLVRRAPAASTSSPTNLRDVFALFRAPGLRAALLFQGVNSAVGAVLLALWGGPWLANVYGLDLGERGLYLAAMALAAAASALPWGWLARSETLSRASVLTAAVVTCGSLGLAATGMLPRESLVPWLVALGLVTGSYPAVLNEVRLSLRRDMLIHVVAVLTTGSMAAVFAVQIMTGLLIDAFPGSPGLHPHAAYQAMFGLLAALLAASTIAYAGWGPRRSLRLASVET